MTLDEMQKRLQALFVDKANFDQQAEQFRQQSLMVQGHINELSFIIQSLARPAQDSLPVPTIPTGDDSATQEGNESENSLSEHQDGDCSGEAAKASGCDSVE